MLGLHLYTFIIGHTSWNMGSKLNKLKLQNELQNFVTKGMFGQKVQTTLAGTGN